jgi:glycerol-3-phosphate cytidylyltransferase
VFTLRPGVISKLRIITFGTFDVFHIGHLRILERAKQFGNYLVVGVSSDKMNYDKKQRLPVYSQEERLEIIRSLRCVDEVFMEESLDLKRIYLQQFCADILVMGDDWAGKFDEFRDICKVEYLPRTPSISTTAVIEKIKFK